MITQCKPCATQQKKRAVLGSSVLGAALMIIIPKCSFCVLAYSSAITMCGGPDMYMAENNWASYIPLVTSVFIIGMLLINRRGKRTYLALLLALIGLVFIAGTLQLFLNEAYYHAGTVLFFLAIWINSNFISFFHFLTRQLTEVTSALRSFKG